MNVRLAICMPGVHDRPRSLDWARHFSLVEAPAGTAVIHHYHYDVARCRQVLAERAIQEADATHILWWDDDCWPPLDGIRRLLSHGYPWCTGVYADRNGALALGLFEGQGLPDGQQRKPVEPPAAGSVTYWDGCGLGFCLMETALLLRLDPPWFAFEHLPNGHTWGEDFFCSRLIRRGLGIQVLCDGSVRVGQEEIVVHGPDGSRVPVWQVPAGVVQRT